MPAKETQGTADPSVTKTRTAEAVRAIVFTSRLFEYECRELGISLAQYRLLLYLRHGPKRAGELAAQAAITRPSLSVLLVALEKAGLIRRSDVEGDGRGVRLPCRARAWARSRASSSASVACSKRRSKAWRASRCSRC